MGFDDLDDAEQGSSDEADDSAATEPTAETTTMSETTTEYDRSTESNTQTEESASDSSDRPAFSFDESKQDAIYARKESIEAFEDALDFEVKRALRDEGVRDVPKRELHDALLRLGTEKPERLAELVLEARN